LGSPVQRAQKCAGGDSGVGSGELAARNTARHQGADRALVAVAFGDDASPQRAREGIHFEVGGRTFDLVHNATNVRRRQRMQSPGERPALRLSPSHSGEETIQGSILTEEQDLFLAGEVVIEICRRQIRRDRDVAHPRCRETAVSEDARRRSQDVDAPLLGPPPDPIRTTVRKSNHGSIVTPFKAARAGKAGRAVGQVERVGLA
jgi:hypothetical protein